jgi:hypothetical protein
MRLREFNRSDWMSYAGAFTFNDDSEPLINDTGDYIFIVDQYGIEVNLDPAHDQIWRLAIEVTPAMAKLIAKGMPNFLVEKDLEDLGFIRMF